MLSHRGSPRLPLWEVSSSSVKRGVDPHLTATGKIPGTDRKTSGLAQGADPTRAPGQGAVQGE